jgi:hypothetical protein
MPRSNLLALCPHVFLIAPSNIAHKVNDANGEHKGDLCLFLRTGRTLWRESAQPSRRRVERNMCKWWLLPTLPLGALDVVKASTKPEEEAPRLPRIEKGKSGGHHHE